MKLRSPEDKVYFLIDVGRPDLLNEGFDATQEIPEELFEGFIKRRRPLITGLVNFRQRSLTKQQWRSSRWKFLRGIRKFHRSIQGKRMHRSLGRFLATRILRPHLNMLKQRFESLDPLQFDALKACSSYRTHLYIEESYYKPIEEDADFFSLLEYSLPLLNEIEIALYQNSDAELNEDQVELLFRLIDEKELCKCFAEILEQDSEDIFTQYRYFQKKLLDAGSSIDETYFLTRVYNDFVPHILRSGENTHD